MDDKQFFIVIRKTFAALEHCIDQWNIKHDLVIDINTEANVFEIEFENLKKIILNSQPPMHELWMASELGAYHFSYDLEKNVWEDTRGNGSFEDIFFRDSIRLSGIDFVIESLNIY